MLDTKLVILEMISRPTEKHKKTKLNPN